MYLETVVLHFPLRDYVMHHHWHVCSIMAPSPQVIYQWAMVGCCSWSCACFTMVYFDGIRTWLKVEHDAGTYWESKVPSSLRKAGVSPTQIGWRSLQMNSTSASSHCLYCIVWWACTFRTVKHPAIVAYLAESHCSPPAQLDAFLGVTSLCCSGWLACRW